MLKSPSALHYRTLERNAFTLVEMLVSVALVLIMMTMFAQVFVMSTDSLSKQRGIAENDQRARMLSSAIRNDLNGRTFRDVLPFRANEDTRQLGHSLSRRAGYFEIDEGNPSDDTDDVLQFTASTNIRLQSSDNTPFVGRAVPLSLVSNFGVNGTTFTISGDLSNHVSPQSRLWVYGSSSVYTVQSVSVSSGNTTIDVGQTITQTGPVSLYLSENEPEFDDGGFNNSTATSPYAEICYFLRNNILYRRVLLIRDTSTGGDAQPVYGTGIPILWNGSTENYPTSGTSTFWRDFDFSAFYFAGKANGVPGVRFHDSRESLSNSSQSSQLITNDSTNPASTFPTSLGMPHLRFGHSVSSGLPQDASTSATYTTGGTAVLGRYNLQECSSSAFGYPGYLANDPISGTASTSPFDRTNVKVDPNTGLVAEYTNSSPYYRRGEDILMANVLSFDVKVWDPVNSMFIDIGDSTVSGPFNPSVGVLTDGGTNVVGGRLNSTYGANGHFRFDTWHPSAFTIGNTLYPNEPPYTFVPPASLPSSGPYTYNEAPYVPAAMNSSTGKNQAFALSAIQIKINYRDISSNQIRQISLVQSLIDRITPPSVTNESPEE